MMLIEVYMHQTECYPHGRVVDPGVFNKTIMLFVPPRYACCASQIPRESEILRNRWESAYTWCRVKKLTVDNLVEVDIIAPLCEQLSNDLFLNWNRNQSKQ